MSTSKKPFQLFVTCCNHKEHLSSSDPFTIKAKELGLFVTEMQADWVDDRIFFATNFPETSTLQRILDEFEDIILAEEQYSFNDDSDLYMQITTVRDRLEEEDQYEDELYEEIRTSPLVREEDCIAILSSHNITDFDSLATASRNKFTSKGPLKHPDYSYSTSLVVMELTKSLYVPSSFFKF